MIHHKDIDGIHMTGSDKTYDAIMWGATKKTNEPMADVIARNKTNGKRNLNKPRTFFSFFLLLAESLSNTMKMHFIFFLKHEVVMAELGASTPYIICPGDWSASAIEFHARAVVSMCVHNGHFNCLAAQNIIVSKNWPQRKAFLRAIQRNLNACQTRSAYYPGAAERLKTFNKVYGAAKKDKLGKH